MARLTSLLVITQPIAIRKAARVAPAPHSKLMKGDQGSIRKVDHSGSNKSLVEGLPAPAIVASIVGCRITANWRGSASIIRNVMIDITGKEINASVANR